MDEKYNDPRGSTLHCAVAGRFTNLVLTLLEEPQTLLEAADFINIQDEHGWTPLHLACFSSISKNWVHLDYESTEIYRKLSEMEKTIQLLFSHGADPQIVDKEGYTPFHHVIDSLTKIWISKEDYFKNIGKKIIDHFLQNGADINIKDANGRTPLHYVAGSGKLISNRNKRGFFLSYVHQPRECQRLDCTVNANPVSFRRKQLNVQAYWAACQEEIKPPLEFEWNVEKCQFEREPPNIQVCSIHYLVHLLNRGADINALDNDLCTPLHLAVIADKYHVVEELLVRNANINVQDLNGQTPLHHAVLTSKKLRHCGMLLLKKGALASVEDKMRATPIDIALNKPFFPIFIKFLLLFISAKMHPEMELKEYYGTPTDMYKNECQMLKKYFKDSGCSQLSTLVQYHVLPVYTKNEFFATKMHEPGFESTFQNYSTILERKFSQDKRRMEMINHYMLCMDRFVNLSSDGQLTPSYWNVLPGELKQKILSHLSDNDLEDMQEYFKTILN